MHIKNATVEMCSIEFSVSFQNKFYCRPPATAIDVHKYYRLIIDKRCPKL